MLLKLQLVLQAVWGLHLFVYLELDFIENVVSLALSKTIFKFYLGILLNFYFTVSYDILQCCNEHFFKACFVQQTPEKLYEFKPH